MEAVDPGWLRCVRVGSSVAPNVPSGGDVDHGGGDTWVGRGYMGISVPSSQFCCESKVAL